MELIPDLSLVDENRFDQFSFRTAWSTPYQIFDRLSQLEKDLIIKVDYADEDIGANCGSYVIQNGELLEKRVFPMISKWFTKFALDLWGWDEDDFNSDNDDDHDDHEDDHDDHKDDHDHDDHDNDGDQEGDV